VIKTALDIWREVLEENGYHFLQEKSRAVLDPGSHYPANKDINILEFYKERIKVSRRPSWSRYSGRLTCSVYFNYKTGDVSNVFFSDDNVKYFENKFNSKLRDYKLISILD
jgi:hypothetical protein